MSKPRKILFWTLTAFLVVGSVELVAALLLTGASGRWRSLEEIAAERRAVFDPGAAGEFEAGAPERFHVREAIHPFLGFTADPGAIEGAGSETEAARFGFPDCATGRLFFEPSDERLVVAVVGGSVAKDAATVGLGLLAELSKIDRFFGREIVVLPLAAGGYKQPQQLAALAYHLALGAHFDLVLNLDGFNEVALPAAELVPRQVFPFYPRGWDQRVGSFDGELRRLAGALTFYRERRRDLARRLSVWPWRASHVAALWWRALDARAASGISRREIALSRARSASVSYTTHGPRRDYPSRAAMFEDLAGLWRRSSLQMHHLCRAQGIEYHHFLQPNQYLPGSKPVAAERRSRTWRPDHPHRTSVEEGYPWLLRSGRELRRRGVAFHDLTGIFADREDLLYRDSCCHLNLLGNVLLQRNIARRLAAGGAVRRPGNVSDGGLALEGYDPVSYFDRRPVRGRSDLAATWDVVRYLFSRPENRARFEADPDRFVPRYGGWCAFGMGMDEAEAELPRERYPVDPESFEIFDGRLYLFYRSPRFDARQRWLEDPDRYRQRADATWARLRRQ